MDYTNLKYISKKILELKNDLFARKGIFPKHFLLEPMAYNYLMDTSKMEKIEYDKEYVTKRKIDFWDNQPMLNGYCIYLKERIGNWIEMVY